MGRKTIKELAQAIAQKRGMTPAAAQEFLTVMFDVVNEALKYEKIVKVKGLGTFKVIRISARKSVDVNTGEAIELSGRDKITFTPDATLKDIVNRPFAQFETVILNDGVDFTEIDAKAADSIKNDPMLEENEDFADFDASQNSGAPHADFDASQEEDAPQEGDVPQEEDVPQKENAPIANASLDENVDKSSDSSSVPPVIQEADDHSTAFVTTDRATTDNVSSSLHVGNSEASSQAAEVSSQSADVSSQAADVSSQAAEVSAHSAELSCTSEISSQSADVSSQSAEASSQSAEASSQAAASSSHTAASFSHAAESFSQAADAFSQAADASSQAAESFSQAAESFSQAADLSTTSVGSQTNEPLHAAERISGTDDPATSEMVTPSATHNKETADEAEESTSEDVTLLALKLSHARTLFKYTAIGATVLVLVCCFGAYYMGREFAMRDNRIHHLETQLALMMQKQHAPAQPRTVLADNEQMQVMQQVKELTQEEHEKQQQASTSQNQAAKQPKPESASNVIDEAKYDADPRVRTGAYRIVGVDRVVKVQAGQTLSSISRSWLGPDMECYVEALNGSKEVKVGQEVKIPKLKIKRK